MKATLYVKGVRIKQVEDRSYQGYIVQQYPTGGRGPIQPRVFPDYKVIKITTDKSVLPEDQKELIEMVKATSIKYGFELTVIDVTEEGLLRKLENRVKGINKRVSTFPTLVTDTGLRIEGDITAEKIKALLAHEGVKA